MAHLAEAAAPSPFLPPPSASPFLHLLCSFRNTSSLPIPLAVPSHLQAMKESYASIVPALFALVKQLASSGAWGLPIPPEDMDNQLAQFRPKVRRTATLPLKTPLTTAGGLRAGGAGGRRLCGLSQEMKWNVWNIPEPHS